MPTPSARERTMLTRLAAQAAPPDTLEFTLLGELRNGESSVSLRNGPPAQGLDSRPLSRFARPLMYVLPDLPYSEDALAPFVSADTLRTHHGKHHKTYVDKTNDLAGPARTATSPAPSVSPSTALAP